MITSRMFLGGLSIAMWAASLSGCSEANEGGQGVMDRDTLKSIVQPIHQDSFVLHYPLPMGSLRLLAMAGWCRLRWQSRGAGWLLNAPASSSVFALALVMTGACSDPVGCDNVGRPSLKIRVVDSSGDAVCDVIVRAQEPMPGDELELNDAGCVFVGGFNDGVYAISILRGDERLAMQSVTVRSDECGPVTQMATIMIPDS